MKRFVILGLGLAGVGLAALNAQQEPAGTATAPASKAISATPAPKAAQTGTSAPAPRPAPPRALPPTSKTTPMAERVAIIGLLNKRNGLYRDLTMKPGQAIRIGTAVIRLSAYETTAPWELEQLTGAFVQLIVLDTDKKWRKYFSGWLYKETPSLNVVEHPVYDVWVKECRMRNPDVGPNTLTVRGGDDDTASRRSRSGGESGE